MATADEYAQWIVDNEDKKGSPDFETVVQAYNDAKAQETAGQQTQPSINPAPQAVSAAGKLAAVAPEAIGQGLSTAKQFVMNRPVVQTAADIAGIASHGVPWGSIARGALSNNATTIGDVVGNVGNLARQGVGALGAGARGIGGALVSGAVAPESALMMPYQMAAYEQEKIRANPNAPEYANNPYAQAYRGEYATQGQAGAANARRAVMNMPYGNVSPGEKALLDQDKQQRMRMMMQYEAAKRVLGTQQ